MADYLQFMIFLEGSAAIAGCFNARFLIRTSPDFRLKLFTSMEVVAQIIFYTSTLMMNTLSYELLNMRLLSLTCFISRVARALNETLSYGTMKSLPQEICKAYGGGLAFANLIAVVFLTVFSIGSNLKTIVYFAPFSLWMIVKFRCQYWFQNVMMDHAQHENIYKLRKQDTIHQDKKMKHLSQKELISKFELTIKSSQDNNTMAGRLERSSTKLIKEAHEQQEMITGNQPTFEQIIKEEDRESDGEVEENIFNKAVNILKSSAKKIGA